MPSKLRIDRNWGLTSALVLIVIVLAMPASAESQVKMRLALMIVDPWNEVIGSDTPSFALYSDGTVIYRTFNLAQKFPAVEALSTGNSPVRYYSTKLSETEQRRIWQMVAELQGLGATYYMTGATDQPTNLLRWTDADGALRTIQVYGQIPVADSGWFAPGLSKVPNQFLNLFRFLTSQEPAEGKDWLPTKVEVMIWTGYSDTAVDWPKGWPGISDPTTWKRGDSAYSIYLPSVHYSELEDLLRRSKNYAKIDGHSWAAVVRFPFPDERSLFPGPKKSENDEPASASTGSPKKGDFGENSPRFVPGKGLRKSPY